MEEHPSNRQMSAAIFTTFIAVPCKKMQPVKSKAQEIDLASIVVKDKDGNSVSVTPVAWKSGETDDYGTDLGLFKIDFTDITAPGPMTITYTTKCFIVQQLPSYGATVKNHCRINNGTVATAEQKITKGSDTISYFYKYAGDCNWTNIQSGSGSTTLQPGQKRLGRSSSTRREC